MRATKILHRNPDPLPRLASPLCATRRYLPPAERWRSIDERSFCRIPQPARAWLGLRTSLTAALADHLNGEVRVRVLSERWDRFLPSERELLETIARSGRVREVQLEVNGLAYIVARTVFPSGTARGADGALLRLGTRALGSLLFGAMSAPVQLKQYVGLGPEATLWRALRAHLPCPAERIWARRALHLLHGRPLLVTEVLLPRLLAMPAPRLQPASPASKC